MNARTLILMTGLSLSCGTTDETTRDTAPAAALGAPPSPELPTPQLRRLTFSQYRNTISDLFGDDLVLPTALEPDLRSAGLQSVGASTTSLSPRGVEQYEDAAFLIAEQLVDHPDVLARWMPCTPESPTDRACAEQFIEALGRSVWRRSLDAEEIETLADLLISVGESVDDFDVGAQYAVAALLQSPYFIYRVEMGEAGPEGQRRLTDLELASRLSYMLWNTTPDAELLDAAESGELATSEGLAEHAQRLLSDARAQMGVETFFTELFQLDLLEDATKDPTLFVQASPELAPSARAETLAVLNELVLQQDGDYRSLLTTRDTFIDRRLAAIYGVAAPSLDELAPVRLQQADGRRGLLGQASFLMLNAHTSSTSATLRGKFIRERLLCQTMPSPPANVDTSIPEADATSPTLRQRIATHLEVESCAGCHQLMDPIGLALENFDAVGRWRDTEGGARIDASGDLDGVRFGDAWGLGSVVADHPNLGPCLAQQLYQYSLGHAVTDGEQAYVTWLGDALTHDRHSVQALMMRIITGPAFRNVGEVSR